MWLWILGIAGPIIGVGVGVFLYFRGKPRREISPTYGYSTSLIRIGEEIKTDIEIKYKGFRVENINKAEITLKNTGNVEIKRNNVLEPIRIILPENSIIGYKVLNHAEDFEPFLEISENKDFLEFKPDYMEKRDYFTFEVLTIGPPTTPKVTGIIAPPRYLVKVSKPEYKVSTLQKTILLVGTPLGFFMGFVAGDRGFDFLKDPNSLIIVVFGMLSACSFAYLVWLFITILLRLLSQKYDNK